MFCLVLVIIALIIGFAAGFLVCRNNRAKIDAIERAAGELKK